ncbi:LysR family transcriptional regulator [Microvirga sp. SRT01]|uniref:LysR family transcriptional regulator n=1 Tax=Sphingomonas longa TaxID=2778730 RepID=A0ABS2DBL8_9SPHN|nr:MULTISPECIES: LysR family transcriptional regulator [Alphaproteobacteria]MBM6578329.1 LysR family transcriptional regulator [Sphingomonas sp. BT552]MBR7711370.1 LysR family transcriptional regulator [Microvirga sp. SRT01]
MASALDELKLDRAFVQIVKSGSMSAAARQLDTSVTSIARQLSRLEASLGVRLLNRTTRSQSLSEAGTVYYQRLIEVLDQIDAMKRDVASYQQGTKGRLRVHLRTSIGLQVVVPALPNFFRRNPDVTLDLTLTDERADLVAEAIDVAMWLGNLQDSSLVARRLSPSRRVMCASPDYLKRNGEPRLPNDLDAHNCLLFLARNYLNRWRLTKDDETIEVPVNGNLQTDNGAVLRTSAINGLGIVMLQRSMVQEDLDGGQLVQVMTDYEVSPTEFDTALYVVYPSSRRLSPKTRVFVDFLVDLFRRHQAPLT